MRGIEVGHVFQLRTKYSEAMKATFLDETGKPQPMEMGCYGIGVTRIVAAAIEQNHDERGIICPRRWRPSRSCIVPIGYGKSAAVRAAAEKLYAELAAAGIDVLLDDRDERPGVLFADMELIGIPHRVVVGERGLEARQRRVPGPARREAAATCRSADVAAFLQEQRLRGDEARCSCCSPAGCRCSRARRRADYEPLAASVRARLSTRGRRPRARRACTSARPRTRAAGSRAMTARLREAHPDRKQRVEFLRTVHYEAKRAGLDPQLVLGLIRSRAISASTRCPRPARAATCR